jgi:hypothetical protein
VITAMTLCIQPLSLSSTQCGVDTNRPKQSCINLCLLGQSACLFVVCIVWCAFLRHVTGPFYMN